VLTDPVETRPSRQESPAPRWVPRAWLPRVAAACLPWSASPSGGWLGPALWGEAHGALAVQRRAPMWLAPAGRQGWSLSPAPIPLPFGGRIRERSPCVSAETPRVTSRRQGSGARMGNAPPVVASPALLSVVVALTQSWVSASLCVSHARFRDPTPPFSPRRLPRDRFPCFHSGLSLQRHLFSPLTLAAFYGQDRPCDCAAGPTRPTPARHLPSLSVTVTRRPTTSVAVTPSTQGLFFPNRSLRCHRKQCASIVVSIW
jgi:hypothetical protein